MENVKKSNVYPTCSFITALNIIWKFAWILVCHLTSNNFLNIYNFSNSFPSNTVKYVSSLFCIIQIKKKQSGVKYNFFLDWRQNDLNSNSRIFWTCYLFNQVFLHLPSKGIVNRSCPGVYDHYKNPKICTKLCKFSLLHIDIAFLMCEILVRILHCSSQLVLFS